MGRVDGKVVLITGAARGQGAAEAEMFAREGATVILADVRDELGEEVAAHIREFGGRAEYRRLDITDEMAWRALIEHIDNVHGRLDVLVNNAGISGRIGIMDHNLDDWNRVIDINLWGQVVGMREVSPLMTRSGGGSIVNISSIAGLTGYHAAAYTASKWGLRGVTKVAAMEFVDAGIRVNSVHPGTIDTPMIASATDEQVANNLRVTPMNRAGTSQEIANVVLFLGSDESSFMTGAELAVDGGFTAGAETRAVAYRTHQNAAAANTRS